MRRPCALAPFLALALAWGATAMAESTTTESGLTEQEQLGKQLYHRTCIYCHAPGIWGTNRLSTRMDPEKAVLENRTDLPAAAVRAIVRAGFGSMPAYRRTELSDAEIEAIAAYVARNSQ